MHHVDIFEYIPSIGLVFKERVFFESITDALKFKRLFNSRT